MIVIKSIKYGKCELIIKADYYNEALEIVSITPTIQHENNIIDFFPDDIGEAFLEIPGVLEAIQNLDWSEEIAASNEVNKYKPFQCLVTVYSPPAKSTIVY